MQSVIEDRDEGRKRERVGKKKKEGKGRDIASEESQKARGEYLGKKRVQLTNTRGKTATT